MNKFKEHIFVLTLITLMSGFFFMSVYNFQLIANAKTNPVRNSSLVRIIENLEGEIKQDEKRLVELRQRIEELEASLSAEEKSIAQLRTLISTERLMGGMVPLEGPGIIVRLDDNKEGLALSPGDDPNSYIVHYESLLTLVEEMKRANADAISINGQRLITNSDIRCVGNVILVNTTRIAPPFEISAIGNPLLLERYLINSSEYLYLKSASFPISYQVFNNNDVAIPKYASAISFTYAQTVN